MAHAATGGLRSPRTLAPFFPAAVASAFRASVNSSSGSWYRQSISTSRGGTPFIILDKEQWAIAKTEWQSVPLGANKVLNKTQNGQILDDGLMPRSFGAP